MTSREFIKKVRNGELGRLDAYNKSFDFTNGEKLKIKMLIAEIDETCKLHTSWYFDVIQSRIDDAVGLPSDFNNQKIIEVNFSNYDLEEIDIKVKHYVDEHSIKDFFDYCNLDLVKDFYPDLLKSTDQLKTDLLDFLDSQNEVPTSEKKKSKDVWGLEARYNFLDDLGILDWIRGMSDQTLRATFISQVLGCSLDNAKKLKNEKYQAGETIEEQLERKQLFAIIKQHQADTKG